MRVRTLLRRAARKLGLEIRRVDPADDNLRWLQEMELTTILDVGASVGKFYDAWAPHFPDVRWFLFEPDPESYAELRRRVDKSPRVETFQVALGDRDQRARLHRSAFAPASSLLSMAPLHRRIYPHTSATEPLPVEVRTLDGLVADRDLGDGVLLKIDVQGTEDRVLDGGRRILERTRVVLLETSFAPLYENQASFESLADRLRPLGFRFCGPLASARRDPETGRTLQIDAIFIAERP